MNYSNFILHLLEDRLYVEAFCQKYNAAVIDILPNTEESPARGLTYVFHNQQGGFNITGIKASLENLDNKLLGQR